MNITLSMAGAQHRELKTHLFTGDGNEAVAFLMCGRHSGENIHRLLAHRVLPIPESACKVREPDRISWTTGPLVPFLQEAARRGMALVKVHSHPGGFASFSEMDERSDQALFSSVHGWVDDGLPHASMIMLPDGSLFGRAFLADGNIQPLDAIWVIGDDIQVWKSERGDGAPIPGFAQRNAQVFGKGTYARLAGLKIAVIGCSGTGSIVIEQLARYGVGHLILVDPDRIEEKNLNRILYAGKSDIGRFKTEVAKTWISGLGLGTAVESFPTDLAHPGTIRAVAGCDVVFGCMDSVDGRHLLNRLATFYLLPYFDVGVKLEADGKGGISQICGTVHYLQPGGSSLLTRGLYSLDQYRAAAMRRHDPTAYAELAKQSYIAGAPEDRPAVISINMVFASLALLDFLARIHPYRDDPNYQYASTTMSLTAGFIHTRAEGEPDTTLLRYIGRGDMSPFLDLPHLSIGGRS